MLCFSVDSLLAGQQLTEKHNSYQLLYIYSKPPDDGLQICPKYEEVGWRNKLRINSSLSWFSLHGQSLSFPARSPIIKLSEVWASHFFYSEWRCPHQGWRLREGRPRTVNLTVSEPWAECEHGNFALLFKAIHGNALWRLPFKSLPTSYLWSSHRLCLWKWRS